MPLYEYDCTACSGRFDVLVRTPTSDQRPSCPDCGSAQVRRALSLVARRASTSGDVAMVQPAPVPRGGGCCGGACGCGH